MCFSMCLLCSAYGVLSKKKKRFFFYIIKKKINITIPKRNHTFKKKKKKRRNNYCIIFNPDLNECEGLVSERRSENTARLLELHRNKHWTANSSVWNGGRGILQKKNSFDALNAPIRLNLITERKQNYKKRKKTTLLDCTLVPDTILFLISSLL